MTKLHPNLSGILPEKEGGNYENWFRQQVEKSLASNTPRHSHEEVMAEAQRIIAGVKNKGL